MSQLTVDLPDELAVEIANASRECQQTPEALVLDLLKRAMTIRKFRELRRDVLERLGPRAPSEEDVFEQLS